MDSELVPNILDFLSYRSCSRFIERSKIRSRFKEIKIVLLTEALNQAVNHSYGLARGDLQYIYNAVTDVINRLLSSDGGSDPFQITPAKIEERSFFYLI